MRSLFKKYVHSTLTPNEFEKVADFIKKETNPQAVNHLMKDVWEETMSEKDILARSNPMLFKKIQHTIISDERKTTKKKLKLYTLGLRIAAVLVSGLLISTLFFYQKSFKSKNQEQLQTVSIPYGSVTNFNLPDGSRVWLNSGSKLIYESNFSEIRQVKLLGEAFFEVVKSKTPFIVNTNNGNIKVLGTSFNVQAYNEDDFITTLIEGKVEIENTRNHNKVVLLPGQQAVYEKGIFKLDKVDTELFTSWKNGKMIFEREPFPNLVKRLERWYNVTIKYPDELNGLWYTGSIEMETLSETLEMLSIAAPVKYSYDKKTRTIILKAK